MGLLPEGGHTSGPRRWAAAQQPELLTQALWVSLVLVTALFPHTFCYKVLSADITCWAHVVSGLTSLHLERNSRENDASDWARELSSQYMELRQHALA